MIQGTVATPVIYSLDNFKSQKFQLAGNFVHIMLAINYCKYRWLQSSTQNQSQGIKHFKLVFLKIIKCVIKILQWILTSCRGHIVVGGLIIIVLNPREGTGQSIPMSLITYHKIQHQDIIMIIPLSIYLSNKRSNHSTNSTDRGTK